MAEELTNEQRAAVHNRGGNLLVSAAAGSGKTKVLVDRLMTYLMQPDDPANIDDFLIITYTQAAAAELRGKIAKKLAEHIAADPGNRHLQRQTQRLYMANISTVHSFCKDLLKDYAYRMDIPADFRVADENECVELKSKALDIVLVDAYLSMSEDEELSAFFDSQDLKRDDTLIPEVIHHTYKNSRCHLDPDKWLDDCLKMADVTDLTDASQTEWGSYMMDDLRGFLNMQIGIYMRCAELAEGKEGLEKVVLLCRDNANQLAVLRDSKTWKDLLERKKISYGTISKDKNAPDVDTYELIKSLRDDCKEKLKKKLARYCDSNEQILKDIGASLPAMKGLVKLVRSFSDEYDKLKKARRALDFNDLEQRTLDLLLGSNRKDATAIAREVSRKYRQIMVDEYQDSNAVQDAIFRVLTQEQNNCFMVGDVKQSIYGFRLADPKIFLKKYYDFAPAEVAKDPDGRKILLSNNFRSSEAVIDAVNDVFSLCMTNELCDLDYGEDEKLRLYEPRKLELEDPTVELYAIDVEEDAYQTEAAFVANRIAQLLDGKHMIIGKDELRPIRPDDIVILLRSPGSSGEIFRAALEEKGIRSVSEKSSIFHTEEIEVIRSILQTISNPLQDVPLVATLSSRIFAFDADKLAQIRSRCKSKPFYCALEMADDEKCQDFLQLLRRLRKESGMCSLSQLISRVFALTKIDSIYAAMSDGEARKENLYTFYQLAVGFEASGNCGLDGFLDYLDALVEKGKNVTDDTSSSGAVMIMSIHKSKGLEYPVVFLSALSKQFNTDDLKKQVFTDSKLGLGIVASDLKNRVAYPTLAKHAIYIKKMHDLIAEEMRVLYVAMTRARDRLIMTYASSNLQSKLSKLVRYRDLCGHTYLSATAACEGDWILQSAIFREEADDFYRFAGFPATTYKSKHPWLIRVIKPSEEEEHHVQSEIVCQQISGEIIEDLRDSLSYRYGHIPATLTPSKQTATQLKGRYKDNEIVEGVIPQINRPYYWRKPTFVDKQMQGKHLGTAVHTVMQFLDYKNCGSPEGVEKEIQRLVSEGLVSQECADATDCNDIYDFFTSELGRKLRSDLPVLREFKFSILDDASRYNDGTEGERVLLQGVVDCAILEDDGITVLDFKTDKVTDTTLASTVDLYKPQVLAYARAMERIYEKKVKSAQLYFFRLKKFVEVL